MLAEIANTDTFSLISGKNGTRRILKKIEYILDIKTNIAPLPAMYIYPRKKKVWHATLIQSLKLWNEELSKKYCSSIVLFSIAHMYSVFTSLKEKREG